MLKTLLFFHFSYHKNCLYEVICYLCDVNLMVFNPLAGSHQSENRIFEG